MTPETLIISKFIIALIMIVYLGSRLSIYGDKLGDATGIGKVFIGSILIAAATSLPEFITSITSVSLLKNPTADLAIGNIFGSNMMNILIIAILDFYILKKSIYSMSLNNVKHNNTIIHAIILTVISIIFIFCKNINYRIGIINLNSLILFIYYIFASILLYRVKEIPVEIPELLVAKENPKTIIIKFLIASILVVSVSFQLTQIVEQMSEIFNLNKSFSGTLFLAVGTSLPELVVSFTAVKINSLDIAYGNVLGSNLFNLIILFVADLFYNIKNKSILIDGSNKNLLPAITGILMMSIIYLSLRFHKNISAKTGLFISGSLVIIYVVSNYLLFKFNIN